VYLNINKHAYSHIKSTDRQTHNLMCQLDSKDLGTGSRYRARGDGGAGRGVWSGTVCGDWACWIIKMNDMLLLLKHIVIVKQFIIID